MNLETKQEIARQAIASAEYKSGDRMTEHLKAEMQWAILTALQDVQQSTQAEAMEIMRQAYMASVNGPKEAGDDQ